MTTINVTKTRGNPNLKGVAAGPGAIDKNTDPKKFAAVWNAVNAEEGKKTSDLLLAAMVAAKIANSQTTIEQIRAFASKIRDEGAELKSFKSALKVDDMQALLAWKFANRKSEGLEFALDFYAKRTEFSGDRELLRKTLLALVKNARNLGSDVPVLPGESDSQPRIFDKQKFVEIWEKCATLSEAVKNLSDAGIIKIKDSEKAEKKALSMAKEIRGKKQKDGTIVGITKVQTKDGKKTDIVVEPFFPQLKKLRDSKRKETFLSASAAADAELELLLAGIDEDEDENDGDDEDDGDDENDGEDNEGEDNEGEDNDGESPASETPDSDSMFA